MKNTHYLFLVLFLFSCETSNFVSIPSEPEIGRYDYRSSSVYYDDRGDQSQTGTNNGSFDRASLDGESTLTIYPRLGWSYQLTIDNLQDHTLSDGTVITSFHLRRSSQYISNDYSSANDEFRVNGTTNLSLNDPDGSTVGEFDGLILADGEINLEFESVNIQSGEYVITSIQGFPVE